MIVYTPYKKTSCVKKESSRSFCTKYATYTSARLRMSLIGGLIFNFHPFDQNQQINSQLMIQCKCFILKMFKCYNLKENVHA